MGQSRPLFVYFCYFLDTISIIQIEKSVDGMLGQAHRCENRTDKPVVFIEVQHGSYFGEDDIVRLEDDFGRE